MSRVRIPSAGVFRLFSSMVFNFFFSPFGYQKSPQLRAFWRFHLFCQCNMVTRTGIESPSAFVAKSFNSSQTTLFSRFSRFSAKRKFTLGSYFRCLRGGYFTSIRPIKHPKIRLYIFHISQSFRVFGGAEFY